MTTSSPTFYPNQFLTDIGGGTGGQFKHIFLGAIRILTMKVIPPPDKQQWYYHPDHLGSTSMVTNENGQLAEHTHYFPYGEVWLQERPSTPVPYLFSSKEFDPETGLYDFGARYLNPRLAQWMSTDPALDEYLDGSNGGVHLPPNLALYGYSFNNPSTLTDPDGRLVPFLLAAAAALVAQTQFANAPETVDTPIRSRSEGEMLASGAAGAFGGHVVGGATVRGATLLSQKAAAAFPRLTIFGTEVLAGEVGILPPVGATVGVTAAATLAGELPAARQRLAATIHARSRQLELGQEPRGLFSAREGAAGARIEQWLGRTISRSADPAADFIDSVLGPISLKGPLPAGGDFRGFVASIARDVRRNTATRALFVDTTGLTAPQVRQLRALIRSLGDTPKPVFLIR